MSQGKGDKRRPQFVDEEEMECNWKYAFKRADKNQEVIKRRRKIRNVEDE